jgi:1-acyl-sn-glycerol-3-phosphate acyltransferase
VKLNTSIMSQLNLLKMKRFRPLFWTQFCGAFNDNFLKNALVILITYKSAMIMGLSSEQMVAAASGIFILPYFLFSATAGQIADKFEKSKLIRIIKIVEIGIMFLAALGFMTGHLPFLLGVLFFMGLHSTFFGPIKYSILPQHLNDSELVGGNALIEAGTFLAILLGTIAGGVLINLENGPVIVSLGLLLVALIGYLQSRKIPVAPSVDTNIEINFNPIPPTLKIFKYTRQNRTIFLSILGISWFWFFGASILSLIPLYCKDVLRTEPAVVTLFIACFSVGIGLGSLLCEKLSRGGLELGLVPLGSIGVTLFTFDLFLIGSPDFYDDAISIFGFLQQPTGLRILFDFLFLSIFSGFFIVPLYTLIQQRSEISHRSRIIAANNILNALFMVMASLMLMALFYFKVSVSNIFLILASLNGLVAIYIYTVLPEFLIRFIIWTVANIFYRLKIEGLENIPSEGPAIIVSNHVSFIDWMIIGAAVKRPVRFIMDYTYARGWLMKKLLSDAKVILIATRKENESLMNFAFEKAADELRKGEIVCIFPEGKITSTGSLNIFRPGISRLLKDVPVLVIPVAISGLWGSIFSRKDGKALSHLPKRFWLKVLLRVGEPIPPHLATPESLFQAVKNLGGDVDCHPFIKKKDLPSNLTDR